MPRSIFEPYVVKLLNDAQNGQFTYTPSPEDWRDQWIYFLLIDRFNNPAAPPVQTWYGEVNTFQGGTFNGIREQLRYLKDLGVGALWISPVLKNPQSTPYAYHGYGIQDFLTVEPRFTSNPERARQEPEFAENELRQLIDDAHAQGIYVILDVVLNHTGDVFAYEGGNADMPWRDDGVYTIFWRDETGNFRTDWTNPPQGEGISQDALVWPKELQKNEFFRRKGNAFSRSGDIQELAGDFYSLKELVTEYVEPHPAYGVSFPVRNLLITAHQYLIARFDIDGLRIDTLKYLEPDFVAHFGASMREYALSIGKKNFFTFGEVYDQEEKIAHFIGRNAHEGDDLLGIDAALDFPLFFKLPAIAKGLLPPIEIINMFERRKEFTRGVISSQGEASGYFVTFLDNHDQHNRFHYADPQDSHRFDFQTSLGLAVLFALQGIPCLYYGTEQGLSGSGGSPEAVREALWGMDPAFNQNNIYYQTVQQLSSLRQKDPALRYGRQYFRQVSGDRTNFGYSIFTSGILAFSRILADLETLVVANTNGGSGWSGEVIVDYQVQPGETFFELLYSNQRSSAGIYHAPAFEKEGGSVHVFNLDGSTGSGPTRVIQVELQPGEIQIWGKGL